MAGRSLSYRVAVLKLLLLGTALANVFDNAASSPITDLYLSLLTGDPDDSDDQTDFETTYGGYNRLAVPRNGTGWTIDDATAIAVPAYTLEFPAPVSGSGTITHVGLGRDASGPGFLFWSGTLTAPIVLSIGVPPRLTTSSQIKETS